MKRAFTLVEIIFYTIVFGIVMMLVATVFTILRRTETNSIAAYAVTGEADIATDWLRRDLEEAPLGSLSLKVPKFGSSTPQYPGVSFMSARKIDSSTTAPRATTEAGELFISEYGVPRWSKWVFYAVRPVAGSKRVGELVRWEQDLTVAATGYRAPNTAIFPAEIPTSPRVMLRNVVLPGATLRDVTGYVPTLWGGFRVNFLRRERGSSKDYLSLLNPCWASITDEDENTRLVDLSLAVVDDASGKPNYCSIHFRVLPRY